MRRKRSRTAQLDDGQAIDGQAVRSQPPAPKRGVRTGRQIRFARVLGLLVCAAGFAAMGLGWAGTARVSCTDCQIPYLLSGGAAGLGLVVFGVAILVLAQLRAEGRRMSERLERLEARFFEPAPRQPTAVPAPSPTPTPETPPVTPPEADRARAG